MPCFGEASPHHSVKMFHLGTWQPLCLYRFFYLFFFYLSSYKKCPETSHSLWQKSVVLNWPMAAVLVFYPPATDDGHSTILIGIENCLLLGWWNQGYDGTMIFSSMTAIAEWVLHTANDTCQISAIRYAISKYKNHIKFSLRLSNKFPDWNNAYRLSHCAKCELFCS